MPKSAIAKRRPSRGTSRPVLVAVLWLFAGVGLLPALLFLAGVLSLGRYEGASLVRAYASILTGLAQGSVAAWTVVLGPYVLYLLLKGVIAWWRISARWA